MKAADAETIYTIDTLTPSSRVLAYCDELERRTSEAASAFENFSDSSDDSSDSSDEYLTRLFPDKMYDIGQGSLIKDLTICKKFPSVCCPLYETAKYDSSYFSNDTIAALEDEDQKGECAKYEFMSCCVFADLCAIYSDVAHCQMMDELKTEEAKLRFTTSTTSTTATTSTTTTTTKKSTTESTTKATTKPAVTESAAPVNDKIVGSENIDVRGHNNGDNKFGDKTEEELEEMEKEAASKGITILIVIIGLIALMSIIVVVSKHACSTGEGALVGEDDSLLVSNVEKPQQIADGEDVEQSQQQQVQN